MAEKEGHIHEETNYHEGEGKFCSVIIAQGSV